MEQITLLTKAETAELLRVSESTVERLIRAGKLPCYKINRQCTRIDRAEALAYLRSRMSNAAALRATRPAGPKDLRRPRAGTHGYKPGDIVADPHIFDE